MREKLCYLWEMQEDEVLGGLFVGIFVCLFVL